MRHTHTYNAPISLAALSMTAGLPDASTGVAIGGTAHLTDEDGNPPGELRRPGNGG
jgi:hypothetical protein